VLLLTAITTGLRVSELTALLWEVLNLHTPAHASCLGKCRRNRVTPLNKETRQTLVAWFDELSPNPSDPVFPSNRGTHVSTEAIAQRIKVHSVAAGKNCPTLKRKHITPHTLRHTCALRLLQNGVDTSTPALWLGHQSADSTLIYLHEDLGMKEEALASINPIRIVPDSFTSSNELLAFLDDL
jgi:integrase/recombinase XerD